MKSQADGTKEFSIKEILKRVDSELNLMRGELFKDFSIIKPVFLRMVREGILSTGGEAPPKLITLILNLSSFLNQSQISKVLLLIIFGRFLPSSSNNNSTPLDSNSRAIIKLVGIPVQNQPSILVNNFGEVKIDKASLSL